ncbi:uncharacterized protein LOC106754369 [Vigna radiata var. radiata]|uniref:Uncharacterized protein LOC106754369 n=1 Tax=Vigna radiata var. radiata TaxID=3916 RepID=A0A1S3TDN1_VIGRR|nr:uncharacterized protein LOC106754369 [Vigna radiata var. radiata]
MDVTFVLEDGRTFCIEVGLFDSFLEIKQKVQKYRAILTSSQTLIFDGEILEDDDVIFHTDISEQSRLKLHVKPVTLPVQFPPRSNKNDYVEIVPSETTLPLLRFEDDSANALPPWKPEFKPAPPPLLPMPPAIVRLIVQIVEYRVRPFVLEMDLDDTILQLKEKIYSLKKSRKLYLTKMWVRMKSGEELLDQLSLRDCGLLNNSVVYVHKKPAKPEAEAPPKFTIPVVSADCAGGVAAKMVKIMVVPKDGTQKVVIEVNLFNRVEDLRYELEKSHTHVLPANVGYFFTNKKNGHVMSEAHAFNWYGIEDGDVIEVTPEYVSDRSNS